MNETQQERAENTLKEFLPGDITPEEVDMMVFIHQLLGRKTS